MDHGYFGPRTRLHKGSARHLQRRRESRRFNKATQGPQAHTENTTVRYAHVFKSGTSENSRAAGTQWKQDAHGSRLAEQTPQGIQQHKAAPLPEVPHPQELARHMTVRQQSHGYGYVVPRTRLHKSIARHILRRRKPRRFKEATNGRQGPTEDSAVLDARIFPTKTDAPEMSPSAANHSKPMDHAHGLRAETLENGQQDKAPLRSMTSPAQYSGMYAAALRLPQNRSKAYSVWNQENIQMDHLYLGNLTGCHKRLIRYPRRRREPQRSEQLEDRHHPHECRRVQYMFPTELVDRPCSNK